MTNTTMGLEPTLFRALETTRLGDRVSTRYQPKGDPMVLFSCVDGSPLAVLTLTTLTSARALITTPPKMEGVDFMGLVTRDASPFAFHLTNLCPCFVQFDLLRKKEPCPTVDPGPEMSVNEVNEISPQETVVVQSDQQDKSTMVLNKTSMTVQDLVSNPSGQDGVYYHLSVCPDASDTLTVEKFKHTVWRCVDTFTVCSDETDIDEADAPQGGVIPEPCLMQARLATVSSGRPVETWTMSTGIRYDYTVVQLSTLLLTVHETLRLYPPSDTPPSSPLERVFPTQECCICLDAHPDVVLYQCGHLCLHQTCLGDLIQCPLCRKRISAVAVV